MTDQSTGNFKVIVALKCSKDQKISNVRCAIQLMDKVKYTILPQSEGQFFDLSSITLANPLTITFEQQNTQKRLGLIAVQIPSDIYSQEEVELADIFTLEYQADGGTERFTGRYYIIILNKGGKIQFPDELQDASSIQTEQFQIKKEKKDLSPTRAYIQSSNERNQERLKKEQSKKLLKETKYDPPKKQTQTNLSGKQKPSSQKKQADSNQKPVELMKQFNSEEIEVVTTPQKIIKNSLDDSKCSVFQKYSEKNTTSQQIGELSAEVEYLKINAVVSEKLIDLNHRNLEVNDRSQEDFNRSENKRRELQQVIRDSAQDSLKFREEMQKNLTDMAKQKALIQSKLKSSNQEIEDQSQTIESQKLHLSSRDQKISELLDKVLGMEEFSKICHIQQDKIQDQDKVIKEQNTQYQKNIQEMASSILDLEQQRLQALKEKAQIEQTCQDLIHQMQRLKEQNLTLQTLFDQSERKIQIAQAYEQVSKTLKEQNGQLENEVQNSRHLNDQLSTLIAQLRKDIEQINQQGDIKEKQNKTKLGSSQDALKSQDQRIHDHQNEISKQKKDNLILQEQVSSLQLQVNVQNDHLKQKDQYKKDYNGLLEDNAKLVTTISDLTDYLQLSTQQVRQLIYTKIFDLRSEVLKQVGLVQDQEQHTNNLKRIMLQMQERGVAYIPAVGDNIDNKLALWINKSQDGNKYRQLFIREGEGVYQFGNKKVYVKVEQEKILIRSGGGFMSIEDFLQMFQQREMDNLARSDPLASIAKNAAVMKKIDSMKQVNKIKGEEMSPLRKKGPVHYDS